MDNTNKNKTTKILFIIVSILFAIPSIIYIVSKRTVLGFGPYFQFLYDMPVSRMTQTILYIFILLAISILYFLIIKRRKDIFKSTKRMFIFIAVVAVIFIVVLPFTSSDIFYYLGIGRIDGGYNQNPYYTTITQFVEQGENSRYLENDTVLQQASTNDWADTVCVYGAVWTLVCKFIGAISFGNIDFALFAFKVLNVIVHLVNCYLLYKITNKKIFPLIYGLNPLVLLEGIACVHNDIFMVLFVLLSLFYLIKKKNLILSIVFLALATAIKYFTILLLPFIIIYYFKNEKPSKRFIKCIQYGILFLIIFAIPYLFYVRDFQVLAGIFTQQEKFAKSIYIMIMEYFTSPEGLVSTINNLLLGTFVIIYFFSMVILLNKKNICFRTEMKKANYFIMAFLFLLITNFQPWYIMWLFPLIPWQKAENMRWIPQIAIVCEFANAVFLTYGEGWQNGTPFSFILIVGSLGIYIVNAKIREYRNKKRALKD